MFLFFFQLLAPIHTRTTVVFFLDQLVLPVGNCVGETINTVRQQFLERQLALHHFTMDFQNRAGSKTGGGGVAGQSESNRDRKERLRKLALETIDLQKVGGHY